MSTLLLETPFSEKHTQQVLAGKITTTDIVPVSKNELAQGVACLVKDDAQINLDTIRQGTWLAPEQHILASSLIAENATPADFEAIRFNAQNEKELKRFIDAKEGRELNLSALEISEFAKLKQAQNKHLDVQNTQLLIQNILLKRYQQYRKLGLKGLSPYARGGNKQTQPEYQLKTSLEESLGLKKLYPQLYSLLKDYPQGINDSLVEDYYWYLVNLGDRPAVGLSHRIYSNSGGVTLQIERGYYISHTLDSVQVFIGLIPVKEGNLLVYINRTWTEEISGFFSFVKRKIAHKIMLSEMDHVMKNINICRKVN
ncbi:hypothetical protein [Methyloprofundus sp.]|uniref:hypothetical protein n=1 Tax=Methyloprofundus sp. TaxID=2020875 RepID=UPI003D10D269